MKRIAQLLAIPAAPGHYLESDTQECRDTEEKPQSEAAKSPSTLHGSQEGHCQFPGGQAQGLRMKDEEDLGK